MGIRAISPMHFSNCKTKEIDKIQHVTLQYLDF